MTTVVQTTYRPTIAPAVVGLIANGSLENVRTFLCETAAGIGFGLAVSQGAGDGGVTLGGSAFVGVSVRDITLALTPVNPLSDVENPLDKYGRYTNVAVLQKGDIWVTAGHTVVAGNPLAYNTTTGAFSTGTAGTAATGVLTFTQQPAADSTIVVGAVTHTFKASGATGPQSNIGPTLSVTLERAAAVINASPAGAYDAINAIAYPPGGANELRVAAAAVGTAGNALTLTAGTAAGVTASAATLLGGTAASTAIANGRWATSAMAGELAIISLA